MAKYFQDDARENSMIELFHLYRDESEGRTGVDAFMILDGKTIPFELKTTSTGSVTTVRDFGPDHIRKWKNKHWLIGFFVKGREYYKYGSPQNMEDWISKMENYILPDFEIANLVPEKIMYEDMFRVIGNKDTYSLLDAQKIQKKQYKIQEYLELQDLENGYSKGAMLNIVRDRCRYLIKRGSTLNNPHIPASYFSNWAEIHTDHANKLRELVKKSL